MITGKRVDIFFDALFGTHGYFPVAVGNEPIFVKFLRSKQVPSKRAEPGCALHFATSFHSIWGCHLASWPWCNILARFCDSRVFSISACRSSDIDDFTACSSNQIKKLRMKNSVPNSTVGRKVSKFKTIVYKLQITNYRICNVRKNRF